MSKFIKRIRKNFKNPRNVLVLGTAFGFLEDLCEFFPSIFIISNLKQPLRKKNLIYKENIDVVHLLPDIDVIIMDRDQDLHLGKLLSLITRYYPIILVQGDSVFSKPEIKTLRNYNYAVTDMFGNYHLWKHIK